MMTAKSTQSWHLGELAEATSDFGRTTAEMIRKATAMPVYPLMAPQAAALAAVTAIGFGFSRGFASAFFGALEGAVEATGKVAAAFDRQTAAPLTTVAPAEEAAGARAAEAPAAKTFVRPAAANSIAPTAQPALDESAEVEPAERAPANFAVANVAATSSAGKRTKAAEDLKRISGIGPKLEQVLNARGIRRYADIAAWTPADVRQIDDEFGFEGRIKRDDWIGQAMALAAETKK
jgi:NADH-quinone oxidoreductase subunit E